MNHKIFLPSVLFSILLTFSVNAQENFADKTPDTRTPEQIEIDNLNAKISAEQDQISNTIDMFRKMSKGSQQEINDLVNDIKEIDVVDEAWESEMKSKITVKFTNGDSASWDITLYPDNLATEADK